MDAAVEKGAGTEEFCSPTQLYVRLEVFTAVAMKDVVFWGNWRCARNLHTATSQKSTFCIVHYVCLFLR
jgi:hypothetical protein